MYSLTIILERTSIVPGTYGKQVHVERSTLYELWTSDRKQFQKLRALALDDWRREYCHAVFVHSQEVWQNLAVHYNDGQEEVLLQYTRLPHSRKHQWVQVQQLRDDALLDKRGKVAEQWKEAVQRGEIILTPEKRAS
jgi:hypothetical protein